MKIQIHNQNFDLTDAYKQYLEDKFYSLEKYQENILGFQVTLKRDQKHNKGDVYTVEAVVSLPQKKNIVVKETDNDAHRVIDLVQDKLARQLVKSKKKRFARIRKSSRYFKSLKFWKRNQE